MPEGVALLVPEGYSRSVGKISFPTDDGLTILENLDVVFCEEGDAVIVA